MGALANILPYVGAGAAGFSQGYQIKQRNERDMRQEQFQSALAEMQNRAYNRQAEDAPGDFYRGLNQMEPGFTEQGPGLNRDEVMQRFNAYQDKSQFDAMLGSRNELGKLNINARNKPPRPKQFDPANMVKAQLAAEAQLTKAYTQLGKLRNIQPGTVMEAAMLSGDEELLALWKRLGGAGPVIAYLEAQIARLEDLAGRSQQGPPAPQQAPMSAPAPGVGQGPSPLTPREQEALKRFGG